MAQRGTRPLAEIVSNVETHRNTIRLCNFTGPPEAVRAVESYFEPQSVDVAVVNLPDRNESDVAELVTNDSIIERSDAVELVRYVHECQESLAAGLNADRPAVVARMNDTYFESYDKQRMVMASRIVESRAGNVGEGTIHAGFQDLEKIEFQRDLYRSLGEKDLDVHVYGARAPETTRDLNVTVHTGTDDEYADHWWVAFDGAGSDAQKVVLLAQEREANRFYGFWTHDPRVVDDVLDRMDTLA